ncbi:chromatin remodelling complex Rsc7/Swp82 subunit-domain-containing protein [Absidia repens]|uniref:Chromatin remodelling complex Rsc7/Swp82 subunit-domain-containing protein n=1 Tax=Absidia repens TaxID=90262 RepID=A0A1X2IMF4_9FUNG|nr:chromatin remodelling complex Rsc7/Swp82 subunit-domain-containing protein [Absidia repens]
MKNTTTGTNIGKRKGRPPKSKLQGGSTNVGDGSFLDDESDLSFDEYMALSDTESNSKKRGRTTYKPKPTEPQPPAALDDDSDTDESGETKVDKDGHLLDGRQYRVPTFQLPQRGRTLFMFSKDPAALLNFRDSFVFIKKNPKLIKIYTTDDEKNHLVDTNKLRSTFRTREISVVSARSVFKVFGHRVVKKGRRGKDDYYYTGEYDENEPTPDSDDDLPHHQKMDHDNNKLGSGANHAASASASHQTSWSSIQQSALNSNMLQPNLMTGPMAAAAAAAGSSGSLIGANGIAIGGYGHPSGGAVGAAAAATLAQQHHQQQHQPIGAGSIDPSTAISLNKMAAPISLKPTLKPLNAQNWLHHAAVSARDFSAQLQFYRQNNPTFYDIHTNTYQLSCTNQATGNPKSSSSSSLV